jgi:hypothetical protein
MSYSSSVILFFRVYSLPQEHVLGEPLAINGLLLWLHCSGFEAACHSIVLHRAINSVAEEAN